MLPWIIGTFMATALFSEEDEEEGDVRKKLLGLKQKNKEPDRKREMSFLEIWEGRSPHPLWTVEISDGYVVEIHDSRDKAVRSASAKTNEEGNEEIQAIKHVKIPIGLWEDLILFGTRHSPFSDGYEVGQAIHPYMATEAEERIAFSWNLREDVSFSDWPEEKKKEEIELVFSENMAQSDLPAGTKLYLAVEDEEPWISEIEQQMEEESGGEEETHLVDPIFASNSRATAPVFPGNLYDRSFMVTMQLEQPIPKDKIVLVPWSDLVGSRQINIKDLSRVLENCVDPKDDKGFDPEYISESFINIRKKDRKHWGPIALQVQTDNRGSFVLFFWPYPQEERMINRHAVRVKILSVEKI